MAHNRIPIVTERDRALAEESAAITHLQNADGSDNPTGEATPMEGPQTYRAHVDNGPVDDVDDSGDGVAVVTKIVLGSQAETTAEVPDPADVETKVVEPSQAATKTPAKKTVAKKAPAKKAAAKKTAAPRKTTAAKSAPKQKG